MKVNSNRDHLPVLSESSYPDWPKRVPSQLMQEDLVQLGLQPGFVLFTLNLQRLNTVQSCSNIWNSNLSLPVFAHVGYSSGVSLKTQMKAVARCEIA